MAQRWLAAIRYSGFSRLVWVSPNTEIHNSKNTKQKGGSRQFIGWLWYIPTRLLRGFQAVQLCHWTRAAYIWRFMGLPVVHPLPLYFCVSPCESVLQVLPLQDPLDSRRSRYTLYYYTGESWWFRCQEPLFQTFPMMNWLKFSDRDQERQNNHK